MYDYTTERKFVFTEDGIVKLFEIRDKVREMLRVSGAFQEDHIRVSGDSWHSLACVDYLVERGEIRRVFQQGARQHNIYVSNH